MAEALRLTRRGNALARQFRTRQDILLALILGDSSRC